MDKKQRVKYFARFISNQVKEQQLSLRDFSKRSGLSYGYLSNIINGKRNIPKPDTVHKIAKGLKLNDSILFDVAGMNYLAKSNTEPLIEKKNINGHEYLTYDGKVLDKFSTVAIKRILNSLPDKDKDNMK